MAHCAEIKVDPNPAVEGQPITITFPGPGPWFIRRDGTSGGWDKVAIDPETNTARLDAPPGQGGDSFSISNLEIPETGINVPINSGD